MNLDEFSFFNHQLAGMLRDGLPLEGAVRQLCRDLGAGRLRTEMTALEADLGSGTPIGEAIQKRQLPLFYRRLVQAASPVAWPPRQARGAAGTSRSRA